MASTGDDLATHLFGLQQQNQSLTDRLYKIRDAKEDIARKQRKPLNREEDLISSCKDLEEENKKLQEEIKSVLKLNKEVLDNREDKTLTTQKEAALSEREAVLQTREQKNKEIIEQIKKMNQLSDANTSRSNEQLAFQHLEITNLRSALNEAISRAKDIESEIFREQQEQERTRESFELNMTSLNERLNLRLREKESAQAEETVLREKKVELQGMLAKDEEDLLNLAQDHNRDFVETRSGCEEEDADLSRKLAELTNENAQEMSYKATEYYQQSLSLQEELLTLRSQVNISRRDRERLQNTFSSFKKQIDRLTQLQPPPSSPSTLTPIFVLAIFVSVLAACLYF
eukprot:TRINITY_DN14799_c0_g1_i1.p1 TRINITY_DN14799_c0_g1~~TRINITY_DN14799_c0_g1_i1.p1  ORF type:complete len:344 (-),score=109.41 TRINITY_DN14799_c0_g1_i1:35-1066(-)